MGFEVTQLIGTLVGAAVGVLIASVLILLASRLVMGKIATFGSALIAAIVSALVGFVLGLALGFVIGAAAPQLVPHLPLIGGLSGLVITPSIYAAIIRTGDGAKPSYGQAWLIYLIQLAVVIAIAVLAVFAFRIPIPGMPIQ